MNSLSSTPTVKRTASYDSILNYCRKQVETQLQREMWSDMRCYLADMSSERLRSLRNLFLESIRKDDMEKSLSDWGRHLDAYLIEEEVDEATVVCIQSRITAAFLVSVIRSTENSFAIRKTFYCPTSISD